MFCIFVESDKYLMSMDWIKKYWWIIAAVLVLPMVVNFVLLAPAFTPIVGDNTSWLGFWGGYLGAIISASVAFIILAIQHKQNSEENEKNRKLQINVIKHQQEQTRLNSITEISAKLIVDTNLAKVAKICGYIGNVDRDVVTMFDEIVKDIDNHKNELYLYVRTDSNPNNRKFAINVDDDLLAFTCALNQMAGVVHIFDLRKGNVPIPEFKAYLSNDLFVEMQAIATEYIEAEEGMLNYGICRIIVDKRLEPMLELKSQIDVRIRDYISAERVRIENILVEDSTKDVK